MFEGTAVRGTVESKASSMTLLDLCAIVVCWAGVVAVTYFTKDASVAVVAIGAAYYLTKWVIWQKES